MVVPTERIVMRALNLGNLMRAAELRYVQSVHEAEDLRGTDTYVKYFLPVLRRWCLAWLSRRRLVSLRSDPFYYYLIARTRYYDTAFCDAIRENFESIVNIGCGRDTRSYRFGGLLRQNSVRVLECDQPEAIADRRRWAKGLPAHHEISYASVDLNRGAYSELQQWLGQTRGRIAFVMMEGVSPYIDQDAFGDFLSWLSVTLPRGSRFVYDFKVCSGLDDLMSGDRTESTFRLPSERAGIAAYHERRGFRLHEMELSRDVIVRILPAVARAQIELFSEDCLVELDVVG